MEVKIHLHGLPEIFPHQQPSAALTAHLRGRVSQQVTRLLFFSLIFASTHVKNYEIQDTYMCLSVTITYSMCTYFVLLMFS